MKCERLNRLIRSWYEQVQDESMAPARMVEFMESHIVNCEICLSDPNVKSEVSRITEIVLPSSKMTKAARKEAAEVEANEKNQEAEKEEEEESVNSEYEDDDDLDPVFMDDDDTKDDLD